jgi:hypothetical protein
MVVGEETPDEGAVSFPTKLTIGDFRQGPPPKNKGRLRRPCFANDQ